jgi:hypothetical protein
MAPFLKTFVLITALLQAPPPTTGVRISGRVIDGETGKALSEATVTISPRNEEPMRLVFPAARVTAPTPPGNSFKQTVPVTATGTFQLVNVPRGAYRLVANHSKPVIPYRSESLDIDVTDRNIEDVGMILSPAIPKVPVTARFVPPIPGFRLSGEQIVVQRDGTFEVRLRPMEKYDFDLPAGYYIESISAGEWTPVPGRWMLRDKPASTVQITLSTGRLKFSGRMLLANRTPAPNGTLILTGPAPSSAQRTARLDTGGLFSVEGLRPGAYQVRAQTGSGFTLQANWFALTLGDQNREGMEILLNGMTSIKGQVIVSGRTLEDLMRFKPSLAVEDPQSPRRVVPIDSKGTFEFSSFDGSFQVEVLNLPYELRVQSITMGPSSVTIRVGTILRDPPMRNFLPGPLR